MDAGRFHSFSLVYEETDLWIGTSEKLDECIAKALNELIIQLRQDIQTYIKTFPEFHSSLTPVSVLDGDPLFIRELKQAAEIASTGPMAGIAGYFAREALNFIQASYPGEEVIIENGGDICLKINRDLKLALWAGENNQFNRLCVIIPPSESPLGICSSSGMFGHSYSVGKADIVTVISSNVIIADCLATSIANTINSADDISGLHFEATYTGDALLAAKDDKLFYKGDYSLFTL